MSEHPEQPHAAGEEHSIGPGLATSGAITYLHIPATDVRQAAAFYRDVFGWHINNPDSDRPSFDTPNGHLSGAWLSAHRPATSPDCCPTSMSTASSTRWDGSSIMEARSSPAHSRRACSPSPPSAIPPAT